MSAEQLAKRLAARKSKADTVPVTFQIDVVTDDRIRSAAFLTNVSVSEAYRLVIAAGLDVIEREGD